MSGQSSFQLFADGVTAANGYRVEFALWHYRVKDVQLRPRVTTREEVKHHSEGMYYRGYKVGTADYTTTHTRVSVDNDTRLLLNDAESGEELALDLYGVDDGYYRDDVVNLVAWRPSGGKWRYARLQNMQRDAAYAWPIERTDVARASARGVLPPGIAVGAMVLAAVFVGMPTVYRIVTSAAEATGWSGFSAQVTALGLAVVFGWLLTRTIFRAIGEWWHKPIDTLIFSMRRTIKEIAASQPFSGQEHAGDTPKPLTLAQLLGPDWPPRR